MRLALVLSLVLPALLALSPQAEAKRSSPHMRSATYSRPAHAKQRVHRPARHARRVAQTRARAVSPAS